MQKGAKRRQRDPLLELPDVRANPIHAAQCRVWSPEIATAYWLGLNPEVVNPERAKIDRKNSSKAREYIRRLEIVQQALLIGELSEPIRPSDFVHWARAVGLPVASAIVRRIIPLETAIRDKTISPASTGIDPRVHKTTMIVLGSICRIILKFDRRALKNTATGRVKSAVEQVGLNLDDQTVLNRLREADEAIDAEVFRFQSE